MIKDVKSYFQTVASRISNAFRLENFGVEDELEFWAVSAEHLSHKGTPSFVEITDWVDRLYRAPVHFIYKIAKDDKLILLKRHIISDNIEREIEGDESLSDKQRNEITSQLEEQLYNLQHKISFDENFKSVGTSKFSIGECEHIPLFRDEEFWGIYCIGPYVQSPPDIAPKISIVSRILTRWLVALENKDKDNQLEEKSSVVEKIEGFGSGELDITEISGFLIKHLVELSGSNFGALLVCKDGIWQTMLTYWDLNSKQSSEPKLNVEDLINSSDQPLSIVDNASEIIAEHGFKDYDLMSVSDHATFFLAYRDASKIGSELDAGNLQYILETQSALFNYQKQSETVSQQLVDTYYKMLRNIEKKREKTRWHTPKMMALTERFSDLFGLDKTEKENLMLTAKLHDIGYVGSLHIDNKLSVGTEIEHPLIGEMMIRQLPISTEVKEGIRTHHEWVNGSGSPKQLKEEEISWTGKIIGVFEFVVEFIENNQDDHSISDEEWMSQLVEELVNRADKQFDIVLIPTFVELLNSLGWKGCCELGTE